MSSPPPRRRPRVVHLLPETHDAGAENQARYLIAALHERDDVDVEVAYFHAGRGQERFERIGVPMLFVPRLRRFRFDAYGRARRLRRAYAGAPPDILHTWMLEGNVVGMLTARAWPETKVVITQRGSWNELDYPGMVRLQRLLLGRADRAISNSAGGADMLASLGFDPGLTSVISNGIPPERVETGLDREATRAELGWNGSDVVAWIGRAPDDETAGQKDLGTLFASLERVRADRPGARLALIGATREEIEARGFALPEWATALGWQASPARLIDAADAVVLSSKREGNSNGIGEALMLGLPVATTDCGDHVGAVRRAGGRVVEVGDPAALGGSLAAMLADPPPRESVRTAAEADYSVARMVEETLQVYRA